jgi:hypothetical protein
MGDKKPTSRGGSKAAKAPFKGKGAAAKSAAPAAPAAPVKPAGSGKKK